MPAPNPEPLPIEGMCIVDTAKVAGRLGRIPPRPENVYVGTL